MLLHTRAEKTNLQPIFPLSVWMQSYSEYVHHTEYLRHLWHLLGSKDISTGRCLYITRKASGRYRNRTAKSIVSFLLPHHPALVFKAWLWCHPHLKMFQCCLGFFVSRGRPWSTVRPVITEAASLPQALNLLYLPTVAHYHTTMRIRNPSQDRREGGKCN